MIKNTEERRWPHFDNATAQAIMNEALKYQGWKYVYGGSKMCIRDSLGTVAHATGLVDDTINAENLYSKYPLSNYQLDFYVDNSW